MTTIETILKSSYQRIDRRRYIETYLIVNER